MIKSSHGWVEMTLSCLCANRRKAKATLNDITIPAVAVDAIQLAVLTHRYVCLCVCVCIQFQTGMIQGRTDRGQCYDQALIPRVPRKHTKSASTIAHSGLVRRACPIPRAMSEVEAARHPIVPRQ